MLCQKLSPWRVMRSNSSVPMSAAASDDTAGGSMLFSRGFSSGAAWRVIGSVSAGLLNSATKSSGSM